MNVGRVDFYLTSFEQKEVMEKAASEGYFLS